MTEVQRENVMFALVFVAIVAVVLSLALATIAIVAIRELRALEQQLAVKRKKNKPSKALVLWDQRPQAVVFPGITEELRRPQPVRVSALIGADRRLNDDFWK